MDSANTKTPSSRPQAEEATAHRLLEDYRREILKRELSNTESYDKAILTLSSAALGFSITASGFLIPAEGPVFSAFLIFGLFFLCLSVTISLLAFWVSNKALERYLRGAESYYLENDLDSFNSPNIYDQVNKISNIASGVIFVSAMFMIVAFFLANVLR